jgi:hypothetical protein
MALITAVALAVIFGISVPATWDFISFKASADRTISASALDIVFFGVYMIFLAGTIVHYGLRAWRLIRGDSLSTPRAGGKPVSAPFLLVHHRPVRAGRHRFAHRPVDDRLVHRLSAAQGAGYRPCRRADDPGAL